MRPIFRLFAALVAIITLTFAVVAAPRASAQDNRGGTFRLSAVAAYCEPGYLGPLVGCTPWEGLIISFVSPDGSVDTNCVTSTPDTPEPRAAGCIIEVPYGTTITASIDPSAIPDGYMLQGDAVIEFQAPDEPPTGDVGGVVYVLLPIDGSVDNGTDNGGVEELPNTGAGTLAHSTSTGSAAVVLLMLAVIASLAGAIALKQKVR